VFDLYDRVLHKPTGKPSFVIWIDEGVDPDTGIEGVIYGIEAEDQYDEDWFYWAEENELEKLQEHE
jgi:hypothetical protein